MKLVKFNRAMAPFVSGETRLVPDDVAVRLEAEGVIDPNPETFPVGTSKPVLTAQRPPLFGRDRLRGQKYQTKGVN